MYYAGWTGHFDRIDVGDFAHVDRRELVSTCSRGNRGAQLVNVAVEPARISM